MAETTGPSVSLREANVPRKATPLTDVRLRQAKGDDFPLWDGQGLHLILSPSGSRLWRLKYYRPDGRENRLALGSYPEVSLAKARQYRTEARTLIREGQDPSAVRIAKRESERRETKAAFPIVAKAWLASKKKSWAPETYRKAEYVVETYLEPKLRRRSITTLGTKDAAIVIEALAETAPTLASKARQYLGGIISYAIRQGLRDDGRLLSLRGTVPRHDKGHIPAATTPAEVKPLLLAIDAYPAPVLRAALTLASLTAMRPGIVASARWDEINLKSGEWHVDGHNVDGSLRMKMGHAHIVPLPKQAIAVLLEMQAYSQGKEFVFPPLARQRTPHLHRDALSNALRRMGFQGKHATHGFRGMLRTVARERLGIDMDILEAQLAHAKKGDVQKAYDRTTFNDARRKVMQAWADYLDELRSPSGTRQVR